MLCKKVDIFILLYVLSLVLLKGMSVQEDLFGFSNVAFLAKTVFLQVIHPLCNGDMSVRFSEDFSCLHLVSMNIVVGLRDLLRT